MAWPSAAYAAAGDGGDPAGDAPPATIPIGASDEAAAGDAPPATIPIGASDEAAAGDGGDPAGDAPPATKPAGAFNGGSGGGCGVGEAKPNIAPAARSMKLSDGDASADDPEI